ncbi:MAG: TonB-dependent receptor [Desulfosoma sp.]|uniref:TonB-dependent receptor n=1 Tax=Desulfosoma sp. TaxID=2603217 RepID=UPI00404B327B
MMGLTKGFVLAVMILAGGFLGLGASRLWALEEPSWNVLEEVVVTATRTEKATAEVPASASVVTAQEIEAKGSKTFDQTLSHLPGVYVRRGKGLMDTLSSISLRGIPDPKRTLVLVDGIALNNPYTGNVKFGGFYPEELERVEVVRGPFSSLYGGYAMGGVVNFITRMPEKREIWVKAGYGNGFQGGEAMEDLSRLYLSYGDKLWDKFSFILSYGRQDTNGYPTDLNLTSKAPPASVSGWKETTDRYDKKAYLVGDKGDNTWWDDGFTAKAAYFLTPKTQLGMTFMYNRYEYDYDDPHTFLRDESGNPVWSYKGLSESGFLPGGGGRAQGLYSVDFETQDFMDLKITGKVAYLKVYEDWYVTTISGATRFGGPGYVSNTPQESLTQELQLTVPLNSIAGGSFWGRHTVTLGETFKTGKSNTKEKNLTDWRDEDSTTNLRYQSEGKDRFWGLYVQDEISILENVTAYLGLRQDWWKTFDGFVVDYDTNKWTPKPGYPKAYRERSHSSLSPKAALVYKPTDGTTLRTSVGKAFRPPTPYELYRTWTSSSGVTYAGNPSLKPETTVSWDLSIEQRLWKNAKGSVTYFENYMKDFIYRQTVSSTYQELANVGKAESRGVEAGLEQRLFEWLTFFGNVTYTDSEVTQNKAKPATEGKRLTQMPLWMTNLGARVAKGPLTFSIEEHYVGKRYNDDTNADRKDNVYGSYDPYWITNVAVSYQVKPWAKVSLLVDNLFDEDYYSYYKAPGRSWFAELSVKF